MPTTNHYKANVTGCINSPSQESHQVPCWPVQKFPSNRSAFRGCPNNFAGLFSQSHYLAAQRFRWCTCLSGETFVDIKIRLSCSMSLQLAQTRAFLYVQLVQFSRLPFAEAFCNDIPVSRVKHKHNSFFRTNNFGLIKIHDHAPSVNIGNNELITLLSSLR